MASLVADYGTSSGSETEDDCSDNVSRDEAEDDDDSPKSSPRPLAPALPKLSLPTPDFNGTPALKTSVFINPFVEAEKAKSAILEKHVKMTPTLDDTKMINGRKICWNYRKGRCRFGHNCTFAHDSDLHRSSAELESSRLPEETLICQTNYNQSSQEDDEEVDQENNVTKRKKRPGLAQNLVPGKKVLKLYKAQQAKAVTR